MGRARLATTWLGGCSGCHMSFLDLDEALIELAGQVELVYSPIVDIKEYPEKVDICLVEGAVCNEEHVESLRKIRLRTRILISFGDCAVTGNVPAIRNQLGLSNTQNVLQRAYVEAAQFNPCIPEEQGIVPRLLSRVTPVHELVPVDYYLPGCPPSAARIRLFLSQLLAGAAPKLDAANLRFG